MHEKFGKIEGTGKVRIDPHLILYQRKKKQGGKVKEAKCRDRARDRDKERQTHTHTHTHGNRKSGLHVVDQPASHVCYIGGEIIGGGRDSLGVNEHLYRSVGDDGVT